MTRARTGLLTIALALATAAPAFADATVFLGSNTTPSNRVAKGAAIGLSLAVVGLELEYCDTSDDPPSHAPSLTTGMVNGFVQTPFPIFGLQPYLTAGGGIYRETLGLHEDTSGATNIGGGVKLTLVGPLRVRVDYRVFNLGSGALSSPAHRFYVGLNLKF